MNQNLNLDRVDIMNRYERLVILGLAVLFVAGASSYVCAEQSLAEQERNCIGVLKSDASLYDKTKACQQLSVCGSGEAVDVLAGLLGDEVLCDYARIALEPIDDERVDRVLRKAAESLEGKYLVGVINSIGVRRDGGAVEVLKKLTSSSDASVAGGAVEALGEIANVKAVEIIVELMASKDESLRNASAGAVLRAGQLLEANGKPKQALRLYDGVAEADVEGYLKAAGVCKAAVIRGDQKIIIEKLQSDDSFMVQAAITAVRRFSSDKSIDKLVGELASFEPSVQIVLIDALSGRKETAVRKSIEGLTASDDQQVRIESIKALGKIGDTSSVGILLKYACGDGPECGVAIDSLVKLSGDGVDAAIIKGMETYEDIGKTVIINILSERRSNSAVPAILIEASSDNDGLAIASFRALGQLAGSEYVAELIELLAGARSGKVRGAAEYAVTAAAMRNENESKRADEIISAFLSIAKDKTEIRCSLITVMGKVQNKKTLSVLGSVLSDDNASIRDACVRALAGWQDSGAITFLSEILASSEGSTNRVLVLRGYTRLVVRDEERSQKQKSVILSGSLTGARNGAEKKILLSSLSGLKHAKALDACVLCLDDKAVAAEACHASLKIAEAVILFEPEKAGRAARKVKAVTKDKSLNAKADKILENVGILGKRIFDGMTFAGWEGNLDMFRIEDGAIVGGSLDKNIARNEFLCTKKEYSDFLLRLKVKLLGDNANAGIQIRSRRIPNHHEVIGYQADMGQQYWGCLYDESRRRKVLASPDKTELAKVFRPGEWNNYTIRCQGKRIQLWINGYKTVDYVEADNSIEQIGVIGLQIHSGGPSESWYKDIMLKEL